MYLRCSYNYSAVKVAIALAVMVGLSSCASDTGGPVNKYHGSIKQPLGAGQSVYRIAIGDKLKVTVFGEKELSGQYEVNARGNLPMPLIGEVPARNRSISEFRNLVHRKLADGYLNNPKISVEILNYRPIFVHGEVRTGGKFEFRNGLTMRDAIAMAGGYSYRADKSYALVLRKGAPTEMTVRLPTDMMVMPGDNIRIPERFF